MLFNEYADFFLKKREVSSCSTLENFNKGRNNILPTSLSASTSQDLVGVEVPIVLVGEGGRGVVHVDDVQLKLN